MQESDERIGAERDRDLQRPASNSLAVPILDIEEELPEVFCYFRD